MKRPRSNEISSRVKISQFPVDVMRMNKGFCHRAETVPSTTKFVVAARIPIVILRTVGSGCAFRRYIARLLLCVRLQSLAIPIMQASNVGRSRLDVITRMLSPWSWGKGRVVLPKYQARRAAFHQAAPLPVPAMVRRCPQTLFLYSISRGDSENWETRNPSLTQLLKMMLASVGRRPGVRHLKCGCGKLAWLSESFSGVCSMWNVRTHSGAHVSWGPYPYCLLPVGVGKVGLMGRVMLVLSVRRKTSGLTTRRPEVR